MSYKTYQSLSLKGLYELLTSSVRDMLTALDQKNGTTAYKAIRKQTEMLLELIDEKRKAAKN